MLRSRFVNKPIWSPDGTKIAYIGYEREQGVYVVNSDGTGRRRLSDLAADAAEMDWQPLP